MRVEALYQAVQRNWEALQRAIWPRTPEEEARGELARLRRDLTARYERLVRLRTRVERLRGRLEKLEGRAASLTERVAACCTTDEQAAWKLALRLDRVRQAGEQTRTRLEKSEAAYQRQRTAFEKRKRELHRLQMTDRR